MKNFKVLVMAVAMSLAAHVGYAQSIDDAIAKYEAGIEKLKASSFAEAIQLLKEAREMSIDLGDEGADLLKETQSKMLFGYLQLGVAEFKKQNYDESIKQLLVCEELADLYGDGQTMRQASRIISGAYQSKGANAFNSKDYTAALESFSKGYQQDPSNIKLALLTAKSYAELGNLAQALPIFQTVIETGEKNSKFAEDAATAKNDIITYTGVAVSAAAEAKDMAKVIELADLAPANADVQLLVLQVANNLKKFDILTERADAAAALQTDPAVKSTIYYMVGVAYNTLGNTAKSIEALGKVTAGDNVAAAKTLVAELKK